MKKEEEKNVIDATLRKAFVEQIFTEVFIEAEKNYIYFGQMDFSGENYTIPLEVTIADNFFTFCWWSNVWAGDVHKFCEKMRNYILGFTHGFFTGSHVSVYDDCACEGKLTLVINFN